MSDKHEKKKGTSPAPLPAKTPSKPETKTKVLHKPEEAQGIVPVPILRTSSTHLHGVHHPHHPHHHHTSGTHAHPPHPHSPGSAHKVSFIDGSEPGAKQLPVVEEHKKIACFEPSPAAISSKPLDIPEETWSDLILHKCHDVRELKKEIRDIKEHNKEPPTVRHESRERRHSQK